jgi:hypothetical protein
MAPLLRPPRRAQRVRHLPDRRVRLDRFDQRRQEVFRAARGVLEPAHRRLPRSRIALRPHPAHARDLAALGLWVDPLDRRRGARGLVAEAVDADYHLVARVDRPLGAVGRLLDRTLLEAVLEGRERPAHRVDLVEVALGRPLQLGGEGLHEVRAAQRIRGLGDARLVGENLLGPEGQPHGILGRQGERLVP